MKFTKRTLALLMAFVMLFAFLAACKTEEEEGDPTISDGETPDVTQPSGSDPQTLVVGYTEFSERFSPFFSQTAYDADVSDLTQLALFGNDRASGLVLLGIDGETREYNGTDYTYYGPADVVVEQNSDGTVDYNITLRDDLVFSDGTPVTIDDFIFTLYVYADPTYDGSTTFYSMPVTGMNSYRTGIAADIYEKYMVIAEAIYAAGSDNNDFTDWTEEQQSIFWDDVFTTVGTAFAQEIVDACLYMYGGVDYLDDYFGSEVALGMEWWGFGEVDYELTDEGDPDDAEDDVYEPTGTFTTYITGTTFDLEGGEFPTAEDYWNELFIDLIEAWEGNIRAFSDYESAGMDLYTEVINTFIANEGPKDPDYTGEVVSIEGIKRTGDYSLTVTTDFFEATSIYQLGLPITPLHYYGDASLYDYDNNMFGFPKGDLSIIRDKTTVPMGAGPYKFLSYEAGVVSFEANEHYYKGTPQIQYLRLQETIDGDKTPGVVSGSFDITDPSFNKETIESIREHNSNGELTGDVITTSTVDNLGYGYIGMSAFNVKVGDDPGSQESKYLRTALATVFASYRDTVTNSYYGEIAQTIQYPISLTSWAAPRPGDDGYRVAFSQDVDGNDIFTDAMSELEKQDAALEAAIGFFIAAGYTWDETSGTFTEAPEGASLVYDAAVGADGTGDHPVYGVYVAAKEALATIGITIEISDIGWSDFQAMVSAGSAEIFSMAWGATIDPDLYQIYHSSNIPGRGGTDSNSYGVDDPELDELIMAARLSDDQAYRRATYKQCFDIIMDWAVEIPNYQRKNAIIFSTERVNIATVTPDITTFYGWMAEIENIEMN